ncbi:hypothethical protein (plasmid) [Ralstonia solanacearum CMR15]|nr:hypothethical protein [Ralstonia solanacearum CMR15]
MVETLHQSKQDDYAVRHAGKPGRDFFAYKPLAGNDSRIGAQKTRSQLSTQRSVTRAPSADLPQRQALTKLVVNTLPDCVSTSSTCWVTQVASCTW